MLRYGHHVYIFGHMIMFIMEDAILMVYVADVIHHSRYIVCNTVTDIPH